MVAISTSCRSYSSIVVQAGRGTALFDFGLATGVFIRGPLPGRPSDLMGVGFATTRVNPRTRRGLVDPRTAQRSARSSCSTAETFFPARRRDPESNT
ncbi:carbohydrate porin [Sphingomonas sp. 1P08PE]|uniref:carbohydrate porin n=1 Tax=Sphingomonas sp. 1P08PE TaxID=554122 RepID=UPI00399F3D02